MADDQQSLSRITVSRDALRADLAEMELRLRLYFDEQLRHKANGSDVAELALKLDRLDRGEFTDVHDRALAAFIDSHLAGQLDREWTRRERAMAVLSASTAGAMLFLSLLLTLHGLGKSI